MSARWISTGIRPSRNASRSAAVSSAVADGIGFATAFTVGGAVLMRVFWAGFDAGPCKAAARAFAGCPASVVEMERASMIVAQTATRIPGYFGVNTIASLLISCSYLVDYAGVGAMFHTPLRPSNAAISWLLSSH